MDSNFSVKITADISELQNRLKSVEGVMGKFSQSVDVASNSVRGLEQNANRGRMVAFAFGQVIRDAGFFSQSFGLGLLAISNNIPILIDQLALSVAALQPFAGAISLVGSLLTAGLTIWAYSAQAVKNNKQSLEEYITALDDVTEANLRGNKSSVEELTTLKLLYNQTQNTTLSLVKRTEAVKQLQDMYPSYFGNQSKEAILAGNAAGAYDNLASSIQATARARAAVDLITKNEQTRLENEQKTVDLRKERISLDNKIKAIGIEIKGVTGDAEYIESKMSILSAQQNLLLKQRAENIAEVNKLSGTSYKLGQDNLRLEKAINTEIIKGGKIIADFNQKPEKKEVSRPQEVGKTSGTFGQILENQKAGVIGIGVAISDVALPSVYQLNDAMVGLSETATSIVRLVGADLSNAFLQMFDSGVFSFSSIGKAIGDMIKKLIAAALAAAVLVALLSAVGLADFKEFGKNIGSAFSTISGVKLAKGGIVSGPTQALVGEYPGAKSNPEVVAPLNKLQNILSNSMGGGQVSGVLETRISGNDLVILMNRASRNNIGFK